MRMNVKCVWMLALCVTAWINLCSAGCGGTSGGVSLMPGPEPAFQVGGKVTGLLSPTSEIVLQDNGDDEVTVKGNGSFTFPEKISSGETYEVTIKRGPANPPQKCVVRNGSGTAMGDVWSVEVSCAPPVK